MKELLTRMLITSSEGEVESCFTRLVTCLLPRRFYISFITLQVMSPIERTQSWIRREGTLKRLEMDIAQV